MDPSATLLLLGITPQAGINPLLAADAIARQEALVPDHIDTLERAYEAESPLQAGHVRFCLDQYSRAPRPEEQTSSRQLLSAIVRRTHPLTWNRIWTRALEINREKRSQPTPPPSPTPTALGRTTVAGSIKMLMEILEKEPQAPRLFDPLNTTQVELNRLSPAEKLRTQIWHYRKIEAFAHNAVRTMEGLKENDFESLRQIINRVQQWQVKALPLIQGPLKHIGEGAIHLIQLLLSPLLFIADKNISWREGLGALHKNFELRAMTVDGTHGCYTCRAREKYSRAMAGWLAANSESGRWNNGKWELRATRAGKGYGKMWPPDSNNLRFQTYLDLLGWTIEVEPKGKNILITVDFGNWTMP